MKAKRILSLLLAVVMLVGLVPFAAMPESTVVIGDKAYDLGYANDPANVSEIQAAVVAAGASNIFVKAPNGNWYNLDNTLMANTDPIPAVEYKAADGTVTRYQAKDGNVVDPANGRLIHITNETALLADSAAGLLIADGEHQYPVTFKINTPDNKTFKGVVEFHSTANVSGVVNELTYSERTNSFTVQIPTYSVNQNDTIYVSIKDSSTHPDLINKQSQRLDLVYRGVEAGSVITKTEYDVLVKPVNKQWADRVSVLISNVDVSQEDDLAAAIENQLKVYSEFGKAAGIPGNVVSVIPHKELLPGTTQRANYNFEALIEVPKNVPQAYADNYDPLNSGFYRNLAPLEEYRVNGTGNFYYLYPLIDNGLNHYRVVAPTGARVNANIKLSIKAETDLNILADNNRPKLAYVYSNVVGLPANSILVEYSEPVDTLTAENAEVYTINGINLKFDDRYPAQRNTVTPRLYDAITLLDVIDVTTNPDEVAWINAIKNHIDGLEGAGTFDIHNDPRRFVIIDLTNTAAARILKDTTSAVDVVDMNLMYVQRTFDVAGVTDHVEENMIEPLPFYFNHTKPEEVKGLELLIHSPEQYNILVQPLYTNADPNLATDVFSLVTAADGTNPRLRLILQDYDGQGNFEVPTDQFVVKTYTNDDGNEGYLVELKKDWTYLLEQPDAYHNRKLTACLRGLAYDKYGHVVLDTTSADAADHVNLCDAKYINEDVTSPYLTSWDAYRATDLNGDKVADGEVALEFSEPMQFFSLETTTAGGINVGTTTPGGVNVYINGIVHTTPNLTASQEQIFDVIGSDGFDRAPDMYPVSEFYEMYNGFGIGVPSFEYVKINSMDDMRSLAIRYHGEIVIGSVNDDDFNCTVVPVEQDGTRKFLEPGYWKLVVRQATDDVGNSMCTKEIPFEVKGTVVAQGYLNPYVLWAYAVDNPEVDGQNDYIRILYSRKMTSEAITFDNYDLAGQPIEGASAPTAENVVLYRKGVDASGNEIYFTGGDAETNGAWVGTLVTLTLNNDTFENGDDINKSAAKNIPRKNGLTIKDMTAVNDNVSVTADELLYDNNNGSNVYYLTFEDVNNNNGNPNHTMVINNSMVMLPIRSDIGTTMRRYSSPGAHYRYTEGIGFNVALPDRP